MVAMDSTSKANNRIPNHFDSRRKASRRDSWSRTSFALHRDFGCRCRDLWLSPGLTVSLIRSFLASQPVSVAHASVPLLGPWLRRQQSNLCVFLDLSWLLCQVEVSNTIRARATHQSLRDRVSIAGTYKNSFALCHN